MNPPKRKHGQCCSCSLFYTDACKLDKETSDFCYEWDDIEKEEHGNTESNNQKV